MPAFIFMLTRDDVTVPDALAVVDDIADAGVTHVGFKDIGLRRAEMHILARRIREIGAEAYLEVVSLDAAEELQSIRTGLDLGVDWLLGGTHVDAALDVLRGAAVRYCPFPGPVVGHPSVLLGPASDIVASARELAARPGVYGVDLLAYRFDGDVPALAADVVKSVDGPVIAAGGIDRLERIELLTRAGVHAFTIGTAVFDGSLEQPLGVRGVRDVVAAIAGLVGEGSR